MRWDARRYAKRALLTGVYSATELYMLTDASPGGCRRTPGSPAALLPLLARCLAVHPRRRPPSACWLLLLTGRLITALQPSGACARAAPPLHHTGPLGPPLQRSSTGTRAHRVLCRVLRHLGCTGSPPGGRFPAGGGSGRGGLAGGRSRGRGEHAGRGCGQLLPAPAAPVTCRVVGPLPRGVSLSAVGGCWPSSWGLQRVNRRRMNDSAQSCSGAHWCSSCCSHVHSDWQRELPLYGGQDVE